MMPLRRLQASRLSTLRVCSNCECCAPWFSHKRVTCTPDYIQSLASAVHPASRATSATCLVNVGMITSVKLATLAAWGTVTITRITTNDVASAIRGVNFSRQQKRQSGSIQPSSQPLSLSKPITAHGLVHRCRAGCSQGAAPLLRTRRAAGCPAASLKSPAMMSRTSRVTKQTHRAPMLQVCTTGLRFPRTMANSFAPHLLVSLLLFFADDDHTDDELDPNVTGSFSDHTMHCIIEEEEEALKGEWQEPRPGTARWYLVRRDQPLYAGNYSLGPALWLLIVFASLRQSSHNLTRMSRHDLVQI